MKTIIFLFVSLITSVSFAQNYEIERVYHDVNSLRARFNLPALNVSHELERAASYHLKFCLRYQITENYNDLGSPLHQAYYFEYFGFEATNIVELHNRSHLVISKRAMNDILYPYWTHMGVFHFRGWDGKNITVLFLGSNISIDGDPVDF